jgi:hypothetical protein
MKLTESKLRNIIQEELKRLSEQDLGGNKYLAQFQQYLSMVGRELGRGGLEFEYKGHHIVLDPADFFLSVSMFRDKYDEQPLVSAIIEDDAVRYKTPSATVSRPDTSSEMYRSPDQVTSRMIEMASEDDRPR